VPIFPSKPRKAMVIFFSFFSGLLGSIFSLLILQSARIDPWPKHGTRKPILNGAGKAVVA
jgi:hypothetical protein